jgi:hypothetical protein
MADPQVLTTLRRKQAEIENVIAAYEKRAEEARRDLAAINAAIRLFSVGLTGCCGRPSRFGLFMHWRSNANAAELPMAGGRGVGLGCRKYLSADLVCARLP